MPVRVAGSSMPSQISGENPGNTTLPPCSTLLSVGQNVLSLQKDEAWRVNVRILVCDIDHGYLCGTMEALNVPMADTPVRSLSSHQLASEFPLLEDFFGAIRARVYDDEVRNWIASIGVENVGKKLVNSREAPPTFDKPKMIIDKLLEYGTMLVQEQENVKRVQLADKYLNEAALGDANEDAIKNGTFYDAGKAAQQVHVPVPEGCTDPNAANFDPTARSDDGSCVYQD